MDPIERLHALNVWYGFGVLRAITGEQPEPTKLPRILGRKLSLDSYAQGMRDAARLMGEDEE